MNNNNLNLNENNKIKTECPKSDMDSIDKILSDTRYDDIFYLKSIGYKWNEITKYFNLSERQCRRIYDSKCPKSDMTI